MAEDNKPDSGINIEEDACCCCPGGCCSFPSLPKDKVSTITEEDGDNTKKPIDAGP